ncbi:MAG: gamma-glutamyl-gamma-aminobutyrate hydrolase family protein [Romboutsia sp.]
MKPIIGILGNLDFMNDDSIPGLEQSYVCNDYINTVINGGGVPFIVPVNTNEEVIRRQLEIVDGIVISGGWDVNPLLYGEEPENELTFVYPEVDDFDLIAIKIALELEKPILGICRGLQVLNVALGGTMYQDLKYIEESHIKHSQSTKKYLGTHSIKIEEGCKLEVILGNDVLVNSYHHQSIKKLGEGLKAIAYSKDGVIEAIEKEGTKFVVGVQWHPEMMSCNCDKMLDLFKHFTKECSMIK